MKLWLLKPRIDRPDNPDPWSQWWCRAWGFVVRANTEKEARTIAQAGAEESGGLDVSCEGALKPWIKKKYVDCVEVSTEGKSQVILQHFEQG